MRKAIKLQVLMAGDYDIAQGKKIGFQFDSGKKIYIASCEGKAFGILKTLLSGTRKDLERLGPSFWGTAVHVLPVEHDMAVKVFLKKGRRQPGRTAAWRYKNGYPGKGESAHGL